jgi:hypothetical protein
MIALSFIFGALSTIILYAELMNIFGGTKYNIIYNIVTAPRIVGASSYIVANVN